MFADTISATVRFHYRHIWNEKYMNYTVNILWISYIFHVSLGLFVGVNGIVL